jgi:hypothetical protein
MADIQVANTDANLSGNTLVTEEEDYTITGLHTFARSATGLIVSTKAVIGSVAISGEWTGSLVGAQLGGLGILASHDSAVAGNSMDVAYNAVAGSGNNSEYMISSEEASKIVLSNGINFQVAGTGTAGATISFTDALSITSAGNIALSGTITAGTWEGTDIGVAHGGTGVSTLTDGGVLLGSGTGAITAMSVLTDGQMIVGDGSGDPVAESGATLRTSIGVGTGDSPQFTGLTISGTGVSSLDVGGGINVGTGNVSLVGTDGKISGPLSSTIIDDLSGANLISLNASNISSGTLANARLPTNVDLGGTLDVTGRLLVDSVGPSAIGQAVSGTTSLVLGGAFTSDGSSNYAYKVNVAGSLTGAAGDTARLALFRVGGTGVTTAAASETTTLVTSAYISEPSLTKGSGSTVTNATALYIDAAPSGATNNYALWVDAGATQLDGTLTVVDDLAVDTDTLFVDAGEDKVYIGHTASVGTGADLQVANAGGVAAQVSRWSNDAGGPNILLMKSRASTVGGSAVIVADDDPLGFIQWQADDGTDQASTAASIAVYVDGTPGANDMPGRMTFATTADGDSSGTVRMALLSSGNIGLGTETPVADLDVTISGQAKTDTGGVYAYLGKSNEASNYASLQLFAMGGTAQADRKWKFQTVEAGVANAGSIILQESGGTVGIGTATAGSTLTVNGSVSKSSGSFRIDHPLPAKQDTHHLVHSFIEGPRCDLIYRGTVTLVDGTADVDLDDAAGMSTGTWATLCRDEQCYTSNETGWHHVRGSVTGSTLTIDCEEATCTDTVSWMVVAERQDTHIMETDWTDEDGHVIVEPEKPAPDPE